MWKEYRDLDRHRIESLVSLKKDIVAQKRLLTNLQYKLHGHGATSNVSSVPKQRTEKEVSGIQDLLEHLEVSESM